MDEYIGRQTAIDALNEQIAYCDKALGSLEISMNDEYAVKVERASLAAYKEQLEALPAADVVPVVHGEWEDKEVIHKRCIEEWQSARCSACGKYHTTPYMYYFDDFKFCPNCGAKMGEKQKIQYEKPEIIKGTDLVPVVRCEDCKHHSFDAGYGNYWCNLTSGARKVKRFDFCSYGERKEEYEAD